MTGNVPKKTTASEASLSKAMPLWRRWLLMVLFPIVLPAALFGVLVFFVMCGIAILWMLPLKLWRERKFRRFLRERGRLIEMEILRPRLESGEGTLIEEQGPKGTYLVWWTKDDLASQEPLMDYRERVIALFTDRDSDAYEQVREFNALCLAEYIARDKGKAILTTIPARRARSGSLKSEFPFAKHVTAVPPPTWWRENRAV